MVCRSATASNRSGSQPTCHERAAMCAPHGPPHHALRHRCARKPARVGSRGLACPHTHQAVDLRAPDAVPCHAIAVPHQYRRYAARLSSPVASPSAAAPSTQSTAPPTCALLRFHWKPSETAWAESSAATFHRSSCTSVLLHRACGHACVAQGNCACEPPGTAEHSIPWRTLQP